MTKVLVPTFELCGPRCEEAGCTGVLIQTITLSTQEVFYRCSVCRTESGRMSAEDKLDWAKRIIARARVGTKSD